MLLSELVGKRIYSSGKVRGICRGVGIWLKSRTVKYLICADIEQEKELFLSVGLIAEISPSGIRMKSFRPVAAQKAARFFCSRPVYSETGDYLGISVDLEMENNHAVALITDGGERYSAYSITALSDAVLIKRRPVFPLGEKIPVPLQSQTKSPVVSKAVLKRAIEDGRLITLTLSLPLFTQKSS